MNLILRTLTGIAIVAVIAGCILGGFYWSMGLFGILTLASTLEFVNICRKEASASVWSVVPALLSYLTAIWLFCDLSGNEHSAGKRAIMVAFSLFILSSLILLACELYRLKTRPVINLSVGLMPILYIALPFSLVPILGLWCGAQTGAAYNGLFPLALFVFVWCNDVGAYCVGCTLGRHRLFPRVSPKKSWEGSAGGAILTIAAAIVMARAMPEHFGFMPASSWAVIALLTVVFGTLGDLTESLIKRGLDIKDSGRILPGHGGFLDRFDSTLFVVPAVAAFLLLCSLSC